MFLKLTFMYNDNFRFDISNTDHVMSVKLLDRITIICPQPSIKPWMPYEFTKLYAVIILQNFEILKKMCTYTVICKNFAYCLISVHDLSTFSSKKMKLMYEMFNFSLI
ncbi:unnamed protein product [Thelazia callipaeda]|uniref:Uncharacterized protein n=1 Tax=Thelazia callipaeda TaxID=103827 RepID=A0A0N5CRN5_THECL|nr:unnamed protein product [Thelazia callipaeda]